MPDYYIIPIHKGAGGLTIAAVEAALNADHTAIRVVAIVTYSQAYPTETITRITKENALAAVSSQHHAHLRAGAQPQLIYFAIQATPQQSGKITWLAGGGSPADPIWLIPGDDGKDHVVSIDAHAYFTSELPK